MSSVRTIAAENGSTLFVHEPFGDKHPFAEPAWCKSANVGGATKKKKKNRAEAVFVCC